MSNGRWLIVAYCLLGVGPLIFLYADASESVGLGVVGITTSALAMGIALRGIVDEMVRGTSYEDRHRVVSIGVRGDAMAKVYLLTRGEYSDYHIVGAFSTREAAEAAKDGFERNREPYHDRIMIEDYELDAMVDFAVGPTWSVTIHKADGRFASQPHEQPDFRHPSAIEVEEYADYFFITSPISGEHAIKVAVEARQKWLRDRATGAP